MSAVAFIGLAVGVGVVICASTALCYCCCKRVIKNHEKKEEKHKKLSERNSTKVDSPTHKRKKKKTKTKLSPIDIERSVSVDSQSDSNNEFRMTETNGYPSGLSNHQKQTFSSDHYSNSKMNGNIEIIVDSPREIAKSSSFSPGPSFSQSPSTDDDSIASPPHIIILNQSGSPPITPIPSLPASPQKNPLTASMNQPKLRASQKMPIGKAKGVRSYETLPGLPQQQGTTPPFNPLEESARKNLQKEFQQKLKLSRKGSAFNIAKQNLETNQEEPSRGLSASQDRSQSNSSRARIADVKKSMSFPTKFPGEAPDNSEDSFDSSHPMLSHDDSVLSSIPSTRVSSPSKQPAIIQIDSLTSYFNDSVSDITRSTSEDSKTSEIEMNASPVKTSTNNNNNNNNRDKLRSAKFHDFAGRDDESDGVEVVSKEEAKEPAPTPAELLMLPNHTLDLWQQVTKQ